MEEAVVWLMRQNIWAKPTPNWKESVWHAFFSVIRVFCDLILLYVFMTVQRETFFSVRQMSRVSVTLAT